MDSPISDSLPHSSTGITHGITHGNDASAMVLESALADATSLKKSDDFPSKRYLIFDQSCRGSRRIFLHPHDEILRSTLGFRCSNFEAGDDRSRDPNSEPFRFHGTVALGIAALEYARSARASCSPLLPLLGPFRTIADDGPHSAQETESDELKASGSDVNALLTSEDDEDEVTSSVTLPDGADERGYHAVDLDTDLWNEGRRKRMRCAEKMNNGEKLITSTAHRQSERESIKEKLKILSTIVGGGCMNTAALLGEVIHLVKNLQCQTANLP